MRGLASEVDGPGSCQRRDDCYHEPRYARPWLLASSGAAEDRIRKFLDENDIVTRVFAG